MVTDAYYRRAIDAPNAARNRAQAAYVIAGAVATALVAAGAFTDLPNQPTGVQITGLAAFAAWIVTAGLFMYAVGAPHVNLSAPKEVFGPTAFISAALKGARDEREAIDRRQLAARIAAGLASALTIAAIALTVFAQPISGYVGGAVRLSRDERLALSALCGNKVPKTMTGSIDEESLEDGTINFVPNSRECNHEGRTSLAERETAYLLEG